MQVYQLTAIIRQFCIATNIATNDFSKIGLGERIVTAKHHMD
jgi:hypothetical protein